MLLFEHSHRYQNGFLTLREDVLELLLNGGEVGAGLVACFAQGGELLGDILGGRVLVLQRRAEVRRRLADRGRGLIVRRGTTATGSATAEAASTAGVALGGHQLFNLRREDLPLIVIGLQLFLDAGHVPFAKLRGIEIPAAVLIIIVLGLRLRPSERGGDQRTTYRQQKQNSTCHLPAPFQESVIRATPFIIFPGRVETSRDHQPAGLFHVPARRVRPRGFSKALRTCSAVQLSKSVWCARRRRGMNFAIPDPLPRCVRRRS